MQAAQQGGQQGAPEIDDGRQVAHHGPDRAPADSQGERPFVRQRRAMAQVPEPEQGRAARQREIAEEQMQGLADLEQDEVAAFHALRRVQQQACGQQTAQQEEQQGQQAAPERQAQVAGAIGRDGRISSVGPVPGGTQQAPEQQGGRQPGQQGHGGGLDEEVGQRGHLRLPQGFQQEHEREQGQGDGGAEQAQAQELASAPEAQGRIAFAAGQQGHEDEEGQGLGRLCEQGLQVAQPVYEDESHLHGSLSCPLYKRCPCGLQEEGPHGRIPCRGRHRKEYRPYGAVTVGVAGTPPPAWGTLPGRGCCGGKLAAAVRLRYDSSVSPPSTCGIIMSFFTVFLLAVALSMDAFAVALASGCAIREVRLRQYVRVSVAFGFFQFFMPVLGWFLGQSVHHFIEAWDHWLAFVLLAWIGGNMLRSGIGGLRQGEPVSCPQSDPTAGWNLLLLAVATSIDALAVGLTFAMTNTNAFLPSCLIGVVCAAISACGLFLGKKLSSLPMLNGWAEVLGGVVLLGIGLNILHESGVI